jgi:uncharacterized membrane protein YgaE (UPF0421/DUF939 family)
MNNAIAQLKNNFTLESNYCRYTLRMIISCSFTVFLYKIFHLENGYWAAFSVIACVWPTQGQSLRRAIERILGTFMGIWLGILIAHSFGRNLLLIDILLPVFIFLTFYLRAYAYSLYALFTTVVTVLFICLLIPGDWQVAITRLAMTLLGTLIAVLATLFLFPSRASQILPQQLSLIRQNLQQYYCAICHSYCQKSNSILRSAQLQAFKNLQATFVTLQEYLYEYISPEYAQQSQLYQNLEKSYQTLLILEVHTPTQIKQKNLLSLSQSLQDILNSGIILFTNFDSGYYFQLSVRLADLLIQIRHQRIVATKDLTIETATFYEHIQLDIFVETLINLFSTVKICADIVIPSNAIPQRI